MGLHVIFILLFFIVWSLSVTSATVLLSNARYEPDSKLLCLDIRISCAKKVICGASSLNGNRLQVTFPDRHVVNFTSSDCQLDISRSKHTVTDSVCATVQQRSPSEKQLMESVVSGVITVRGHLNNQVYEKQFNVTKNNLSFIAKRENREQITSNYSILGGAEVCKLYEVTCRNQCHRMCNSVGKNLQIQCNNKSYSTIHGNSTWSTESVFFPLRFIAKNIIHSLDRGLLCLNISSLQMKHSASKNLLQHVDFGKVKQFELEFNCMIKNQTKNITRSFTNKACQTELEYTKSTRNLVWCMIVRESECTAVKGPFNLIGRNLKIKLKNGKTGLSMSTLTLHVDKKTFPFGNLSVINGGQSKEKRCTLCKKNVTCTEKCTDLSTLDFEGVYCNDEFVQAHSYHSKLKKKGFYRIIIIIECLVAVVLAFAIGACIVYFYRKSGRPRNPILLRRRNRYTRESQL